MENPEIGALDNLETMPSASGVRDNGASPKDPLRDFFFDNAVTMQNQRVKRIKETSNTIFSVLLRAARQGVFRLNSVALNTTALIDLLLLEKPSQTGILFGDVYINDREFLAANKYKINSLLMKKEDVDFFRALAEKVEETKKLRMQHIRCYYDWNKLVKITFEMLRYNPPSTAGDQKLIKSIDHSMEDRLVGLQRELILLKLNSMSSLAIRHASKEGRQLFNVPMVERISRRILVGVHQLFAVTELDLVMQRKIADHVRRDFRFDGNFDDLKSTQYWQSWNKYFTKIANGYVPVAGEFNEVHSRILDSLKATVASRLLKDRELRCGLTRNVSIPLFGHSADDVVDTNSYCNPLFDFIDNYLPSFLNFLESLPLSFSTTFENAISYGSAFVSSIVPNIKNFRNLSTFSTSLMIKCDTVLHNYHATLSVSQIFDAIQLGLKHLEVTSQKILCLILENAHHLKLVVADKFNALSSANQILDSIQQELKHLEITSHQIFNSILENAHHLKLVVADKMDALLEFRSENITSRPGKYHFMASALLGRLQALQQSCSESLPGVINLLNDGKSSFLQTADQTVHQINTLYENVICKVNAIYDSSMNQVTIIADNLVRGCGPFFENLTQYCVMVNEVAQQIVFKTFDITSTTFKMLNDMLINISSSITSLHNGFCSIVDTVVNTMEQLMVHLPLNVASEVYHGLPQDAQWAMCKIGRLMTGIPFVFVTAYYVALYATCL